MENYLTTKTRNHWVRLLVATAVAGILLGSPARTPMAQATNPIVVDDPGDTSPCGPGTYTLRCAIDYANAHDFTTINFASNVHAILLLSALPTITRIGTFIDGTTVGPRIDGIFWTNDCAAACNALTINADYVTIARMKIVNMPPGGSDISIIGGSKTDISDDYLGILPTATQCGLVGGVGVSIVSDQSGSAGNYSGTALIYRDTISCHQGSGVEIVNSSYVSVGLDRNGGSAGNNIGTTADGLHAAGNGYAGVRVANSDHVTVQANLIDHNGTFGVVASGTHIDVLLNTIDANAGAGLALEGGSAQKVIGNYIGTDVGRLLVSPNAHEGILIGGGSGIFLSGNVVAYNSQSGIAIIGNSTHAMIQDNELRNNGGLPIDLGEDGATPNGLHGTLGPDNWLPYPVVTAFSGSLIQGTTCPGCHVFFHKAFGNPAAPGGGGMTLPTSVFANGSGEWGTTLADNLTRLDVTMTAVDLGGNTSEMSPRPQIVLPLIAR